jgi:hypothetical protein
MRHYHWGNVDDPRQMRRLRLTVKAAGGASRVAARAKNIGTFACNARELGKRETLDRRHKRSCNPLLRMPIHSIE